ncbi:MAG: hypothetical protein A2Y20_02685 [Firmicutes bacterium GWF2_51_9]|uniref:RNA-directed DNA polymerase n=2 Tax=Candidatus Giovannoniibacteriota TaxID=1752738 RepID=A0A0G1IW69_9BACT|nr:MAG: RNA-directed DNA polymerase [Candidatus Giovannonibacteria bacterium GW2011_GWB1_43_13]KKS99925.1 MAG: RNA-directed DNA polymerase [Candidatus Giovannonibacteria bacterium GW2011_GWA1_43_15]KKT63626.1 MAG: RNA-directed DNA polymerase [Candidatus Giovannonibacteria bacterium GW2011_GWA2_44_26]OGF58498.1 MAG: hypothetical protein A2652_01805 [Candidatus Giovannonibacteria bacterium RIFCSPHIGHO2_01_FULL_43_140]OGF70049.1 MAG: hypothetical protein A3C76_02600 [Candidatus Giovannonibacteria 
MGRIKFTHSFENIISLENLLAAWREFLRGKSKRKDMEQFYLKLIHNLFCLHDELSNKTYKHGEYAAFHIFDPKPRHIHKASVRDRLLHHAIYRVLYPFFDKVFIADSYSCQIGKGTHRALNRFKEFGYKVGKNNTKTCWVLKCDIRKFFTNIDHKILMTILQQYIPDTGILWLLRQIINSFSSTRPGVGLPLGNLTSQLFVNIYMNEFDQFVKHKLKARYYLRYADDFMIFSDDRVWLEKQILPIQKFLRNELKLDLHPDKLFIKTLASSVDFLGWVHFSDHRVLRTATKRRMLKRIKENSKQETLSSYLGLIKHGNTHKLRNKILSK